MFHCGGVSSDGDISHLVSQTHSTIVVLMITGLNTDYMIKAPHFTAKTGVYSEDELLNVKFAGIAIGSPESSEKWLESTLLGKRVWFTLLDHTPNKKSLSSVMYAKHKVSAY